MKPETPEIKSDKLKMSKFDLNPKCHSQMSSIKN